MIMQTSCIYLPNARYLDIHVYMAWSHRDPRCRSFRHERALDCCTSDHVFERLLHKSGNTATMQPNQTTSRELSRERWHRMRKVLICPPSPNSCKLICLLNKEICVNIFFLHVRIKIVDQIIIFIIFREIKAHPILFTHYSVRTALLGLLLARSSRFRWLFHYSFSRHRLVQDLNNSWCDVWFRSHSWHCMSSSLTIVSTFHLLLHQRQRKTKMS